MSEKFQIEREVVLSATPEQVFAAVTDGLAGWLFPGSPPPADGTPDESGTRALVWDAPNHLHTRTDGEGGWFNALEHIIEARDGGTTVVRYVHSGVFADDWDTQFDAAGKHTDFYLHSLGQYLEHFAGRPVTYVAAPGTGASQFPGAVDKLHAALGLTSDSEPGDKITLDIPGLAPVEGEVDYLEGQFVGIRTADSLLRFYAREPWGMPVAAAHHVFAPDADAEALTKAWNAWLDGVYA
ncbi:SRPBCC domain-containing protein [Actinokineospora sp. PR83]|uniref:SRPBCC domain-containing protein n=1 Tax=Actinokineospora sp. PR83 TaxID=2884908 RepID=UPI001F225B40|nr:SRPBCC domain-containing protein [Actinokineospora sp. PR83]MCG8915517.1 SRPBCC domain-containing protein [Actinokineospora sp. PR83]